MVKKISFESIKEAFENSGCQLLISEEDYRNTKQQVEWKCKCGRLQKSMMGAKMKAIKDSSYIIQCRSCGIRKSKGAPKYEDFCSVLEKEGWEMLSPPEDFLNTKTKMKVRTKTGYDVYTTYNRFHQGHRSKIDKDNSERYSQKFIEEEFLKKGFKVINRYQNKSVPLTVECDKGHITSFTLDCLRHRKNGCLVCFKEKYGTEVYLSHYRFKHYTFPSGRQEYVQGYENRCVDDLLKWGIPENDIIVDDRYIPNFYYIFEGRKRQYFPDIFLKSSQKVIEVKSTWTYLREKDKNIAKWRSVAKMGYPMEVYIYNEKEIVEHHYYIERNANGDITDIE